MRSTLSETEIADLERQQRAMATQLREEVLQPFLAPSDLLLALDIQYEGDKAFVGAALQSWDNQKSWQFALSTQTELPYHPGLFCFREGPPLKALVESLQNHYPELSPRLILVDGQGLAHPRGFGAACWLALKTGIATLGCAKSTLLPYEGELEAAAGSTLGIYRNNRRVGSTLRRKTGVNPVFVSVGQGLTLPQAERVVLELPSDYRLPDLLRYADQNARALSRGESPEGLELLMP